MQRSGTHQIQHNPIHANRWSVILRPRNWTWPKRQSCGCHFLLIYKNQWVKMTMMA